MKSRTIYYSVMTLCLAVGLFLGGCRHHSGPHDARAEKMIRYLTDELSLTEAQQTMLMDFKDDMLKRREEARQCRQKNKGIIMEELKKDTIDQERVMSLYLEHKPKMDELAAYVVTRLAEFHATLTPEQKSILIDKLETLDKWHSYFAD